jgi:hypothetical protein
VSKVRLPISSPPAHSHRLPLKEIISKCRSNGFTGVLTYEAGDLKGAVLFKAGFPTCAENNGLVGQQALREIEASIAVVRAGLHAFPVQDIDTLILFNEGMKVVGEDGPQGKTTIKTVRIGQNSRSATIRVIKTDEAEKNIENKAQKHDSYHESEKKQILNPSSIEALRKLSVNFEADASDLLREMNMEHLISREKKEDP